MRHLGNASLRPFSQKLRRDMTKEERRLWYDFLKTLDNMLGMAYNRKMEYT